MEHLACFVPGNIALGVMSGAVSGGGSRSRRMMASSSDEERADLDGGGNNDGDGGNSEELLKSILERERRYLAAADALAETCALAGEGTATGLAPEVVLFLPEARPGHHPGEKKKKKKKKKTQTARPSSPSSTSGGPRKTQSGANTAGTHS